jgi:hypothetical protein
MTMRAMQAGLSMFRPSEATDLKGKPIPDDVFVSPVDVTEELNLEWFLLFQIGIKRTEEWIRKYYYNDRPVAADVDASLVGTLGGNRKEKARRKETYRYGCTFFNGRFTTPSKKKRGAFSNIHGLTKLMEKKNKMYRDRLTTTSWRDIDAESFSQEDMFTKTQIIEEIISMRQEDTAQNGTNKRWFVKYLVHNEKKLDSDTKMRKVKNKCQKSDLAKMLANLRIKGIQHSANLLKLNASDENVEMIHNEIYMDNEKIDIYNTPFIKNTLPASVDDRRFNMTGRVDAGVDVEEAPPDFAEMLDEFGSFLGHDAQCGCPLCQNDAMEEVTSTDEDEDDFL